MDIKISQIANLPTKFGDFKIQSFKENDKEHLCIFKNISNTTNIRIHSECLSGDSFKSLKCDCGEQLEFALNYIQKNNGLIIYLRQEGRGIGLFNKVNAYALQDQGYDTIKANHKLGFKADERNYEIVNFILDYYKIEKINLLTNNPEKLDFLKNKMIKRIPINIKANKYNEDYLKIKQEKMGHFSE